MSAAGAEPAGAAILGSDRDARLSVRIGIDL